MTEPAFAARALLTALGAMLGYPTFWGQTGEIGIVWAMAVSGSDVSSRQTLSNMAVIR